ncbi:MAG: hypothetical protein V1781_07285 [Bacteroidota bacterium]
MLLNAVNSTLATAQQTAIQGAIDALITNLPVKINLTKEDRVAMTNIDNRRYPYVQRAIFVHAPTNPVLVSGFKGSLADATNDFILFDQLERYLPQLKKIIEIYGDLQQVAGSEAYAWFREFYDTSKKGAENGVAGSDSVVDDLKTLFDEQGQEEEGVVPPAPIA